MNLLPQWVYFVMLGILIVAIWYGLATPAMAPDEGEPYTWGRRLAAIIMTLVIAAAIWCLVMLQSGAWGPQ